MISLFRKVAKLKQNLNRLSNLCIEIYKTVNKIYPAFLKEII